VLLTDVELDSEDVLWLATELIVTGRSDTAEALLHADDEDTDMALTIVQRDTLLQVLDDPPQRLAQLRAALLDEQTWGDLI